MAIKDIKAFMYNDEIYIRIIPSKRLFNSTMVHEVVNRGDVFAMRLRDQQFTIIPGLAKVTHGEIMINTTLQVELPF